MKYLGSEKHLENANKAIKLALLKLIEKREDIIEEYNKNPKKCLNCGNALKYEEKHKKFCNSSCAAKYNNEKRVLSNETKELIRSKLIGIPQSEERKEKTSKEKNGSWKGGISKNYMDKQSGHVRKKRINKVVEYVRDCVICGRELVLEKTTGGAISKATTCSSECRTTLKSKNQKFVIERLISDGKHKGWEKRNIISYPEKFFIDVLNNNNIKFEHNYPVKQSSLGINNGYNFFLDFFIEDKKIDLEIDGQQHSSRQQHDIERDSLLTNCGYFVYRINWKSIKSENGKEYIKNEINKFLEFYKNI